jgi:hypothetical protein
MLEAGFNVECEVCNEAFDASIARTYVTETWVRGGEECITHCKGCKPDYCKTTNSIKGDN